jgi:hypothetical protein
MKTFWSVLVFSIVAGATLYSQQKANTSGFVEAGMDSVIKELVAQPTGARARRTERCLTSRLR